MAEFKLSRIRFNWKGPWTGGNDYIVDDMVEYNGFTYVALRTHTAGTFYNDEAGTDVTPAQPKWKKQSEGKVWKNGWTVSTDYAVGNLVKYVQVFTNVLNRIHLPLRSVQDQMV